MENSFSSTDLLATTGNTKFTHFHNFTLFLTIFYTGKKGVVAKCGDTGKKLQGVKANRATALQPGRTTRRSKTVTRAYGGCVSANALKRRITRAFLIEEQKIVVKVMKAQQEAAQKAAKEAEAGKGKKKSKKSKK